MNRQTVFEFDGKTINMKVVDNEYYLKVRDLSRAIGYKSTISVPDNADTIRSGGVYIAVKDAPSLLQHATGIRGEKAGELIKKLEDAFLGRISVPKPSPVNIHRAGSFELERRRMEIKLAINKQEKIYLDALLVVAELKQQLAELGADVAYLTDISDIKDVN